MMHPFGNRIFVIKPATETKIIMKTLAVKKSRSAGARSLQLFASGLIFWLVSGLAHAVPISFTIDNVNVDFSNETGICIGGCTPVVNTPTPIEFELSDVGQTTSSFDLFDISIGGLAVGFGSADVLTTISFSTPSASSTSANGTGTFRVPDRGSVNPSPLGDGSSG